MRQITDLGVSDLLSGAPFGTLGRTITEADIVGFAGLTGDWNPQHCDADWAAEHSPFGGRIAHGLLVVSAGTGMVLRHLPPPIRLREAKATFKRPVSIGESIYVQGRIVPGRELAKVRCNVLRAREDLAVRLSVTVAMSEGAGSELDPAPFDPPPAPLAELSRADIQAGRPFATHGRTLTAADVTAFAAVTGDWSPQFADVQWARAGNPGGHQQIPPLLAVCIAAASAPIDVPHMLAARKSVVRFGTPLRVGDTIHTTGRLVEQRELDADLAEENWEWRVLNERREVVVAMQTAVLMAPRPVDVRVVARR